MVLYARRAIALSSEGGGGFAPRIARDKRHFIKQYLFKCRGIAWHNVSVDLPEALNAGQNIGRAAILQCGICTIGIGGGGIVGFWRGAVIRRAIRLRGFKKVITGFFVAIIVGALLPLFAEGDYNFAAAAFNIGVLDFVWHNAADIGAQQSCGGGFMAGFIAHFGIGFCRQALENWLALYQSERDVKMLNYRRRRGTWRNGFHFALGINRARRKLPPPLLQI